MNACYVYDLTLRTTDADGNPIGVGDVHSTLRPWCKKWSFQLEKGTESTELNPDGYPHYQCRFAFVKKRREGEAGKWLANLGWKGKLTPTSNENRDNSFYVMKADTRVEGPWTDKDFVEPPPKTWQLEEFLSKGLAPWMTQIVKMIEENDMRHINMVINPIGNKGKSLFCEYMEYEGKAFEAPPINNFDDLMQALHGVPAQKCYLVDLPKGMRKEKLSQFFSGIEYLKNGVTYDKRYAFKKRRMGRPHIFIFTNTPPNMQYMSPDRWKLWTIEDDQLVVFKHEDYECPSDEDGF